MGPKGPSAKGEEMTLEERVRRIEKWLTSNSAAEMISINGAIRASLDAPRDPHPEDTANLSFEQRVALRLLECYPTISADDLGNRVREIRAVVDAPRAEAEPAPAGRPADLAYGDGRVSVWREIEAVLVGSETDVTKPIPTRIRFLVAEGKRLRAERDEARGEAARARAVVDGKAGGEPAPTESANAKRLTVRDAARNRQPLGGADAQALEGALAQADRERDSLRAERDAEQRRAMAAESERDVLREEHTARVLENSDLAHERDEAREERDSLRDQLAECQRVLALGEKVDAITKEKIAHLERGVREAARLLRSAREFAFVNFATWPPLTAWLREFGS